MRKSVLLSHISPLGSWPSISFGLYAPTMGSNAYAQRTRGSSSLIKEYSSFWVYCSAKFDFKDRHVCGFRRHNERQGSLLRQHY